jgi:hypothetical protein
MKQLSLLMLLAILGCPATLSAGQSERPPDSPPPSTVPRFELGGAGSILVAPSGDAGVFLGGGPRLSTNLTSRTPLI